MKYELVLLDLDNTLFDFDEAQRRAFTQTVRDWGWEPTDRLFERFLKANEKVWQAFERGQMTKSEALVERFARLLGPEADAAAVNQTFLEHLAEPPRLLEGAGELVEFIQSRAKLGIVTNGDAKTQRRRIAGSSLELADEVITISDEVGVGKPHPKIFHAALQKASLAADRPVAMVGDNLHADIVGAQRLGFDTLWLNPLKKPCFLDTRPSWTGPDLSGALQFLRHS